MKRLLVSALLLLLLSGSAWCLQVEITTKEAWAGVSQIIQPNGLSFEIIPENQHSNIVHLAYELIQTGRYEPSPDEIQRTWNEKSLQGFTRAPSEVVDLVRQVFDQLPPKNQKLDTRSIDDLTQIIRLRKFFAENRVLIDRILQAGFSAVFKTLATDGNLSRKGTALVVIPCPAPGYNNTLASGNEAFLLEACRAARKGGAQIVIVRTPFGMPERLNQYGNAFILPKKLEEFKTSGPIKIVDSYPGGHNTPWAILYRDGKLLSQDYLYRLAEDPLPILSELEKSSQPSLGRP